MKRQERQAPPRLVDIFYGWERAEAVLGAPVRGRENRSPSRCKPRGWIGGKADRKDWSDLQVLPLPAGDGWGEGERNGPILRPQIFWKSSGTGLSLHAASTRAGVRRSFARASTARSSAAGFSAAATRCEAPTRAKRGELQHARGGFRWGRGFRSASCFFR